MTYPLLEPVMQAELDLSRRRAHTAYQAEILPVGNSIVRISVAGNVEDVEKIGTEADYVTFAPEVEFLEQGRVHLAVARGALGVDRRSAESRPGDGGRAVSTGPIVGTGAAMCGWIGSPPVSYGTIAHDQLPVLVGPWLAVAVCIACAWPVDSDGKP